MNGIHEVTGSIPVWSTILRSLDHLPRDNHLELTAVVADVVVVHTKV